MAPEIPHRRLHARVYGRVQGVFFRVWTQEQAQQLGLNGWVRNTPEGHVEILAQGPPSALEELVTRCHQGPSAVKVTQVDTDWEELGSDLEEFHIRH